MKGQRVTPPTFLEAWLEACLPDGAVRESVAGDLREDFEEVRARRGRATAVVWYAWQAARLGMRYSGQTHTRKGSVMGDMRQDIRFAFRTFRRSPGLFAVALLTLALGIGANTAIFSVVNSVLLRPLDYPASERIVRVGHAELEGSITMGVTTPGNFFDWKAAAESFESLAAYNTGTASLMVDGRPIRIQGTNSVGSIFDVLGTPALLGRTFTDAEDGPGPEDGIVLGYGLWQRAFGGADVIGRAISLSGSSFTVLGVMPPGFDFPAPQYAEYWIQSDFDEELMSSRTEYFLRSIARLAPGWSLEQSRQEMESVAARLREEFPRANRNVTVGITPLHEMTVGNIRPLLLLLEGAVGMVLLIACVNLANLLLSRAFGREHEIAVRRALGAGSSRLLRQVFTESAVLALAGGVVGMGVGVLMLKAIITWMPGGLPRVEEVTVDGTALAFTLGISLLASLLFGCFPAAQLLRSGPHGRLRASGHGANGARLGGGLVVVEVALAVVLLMGAGLLARSFSELAAVDPGYEVENRVTFQLSLPGASYDPAGRVEFFRELEERIAAIPGVTSSGITTGLPGSDYGSRAWLNIMDRPHEEGATPPLVGYRVVNPGYLSTMGIRLLQGRMIERSDGLLGSPSVVVNQTLAERFWPEQDPLGKQITLGPDPGWIPPTTIVGIVSDVRMNGLGRAAPAVVYSPHELQPWWSGFTTVVHSTTDPSRLLPQIREVVRALDSTVPIYSVSSVEGLLSDSTAVPRNSMILLTLLAGVALLMASVGVFGVLSFAVSRRVREMGIRIALGAGARDVRRLVMRQGMQQVAAGLTLGALGALGLTRLMASQLYGVSPTDPLTFAIVSALLVVVAGFATYVPARRATRVDPVRALSE